MIFIYGIRLANICLLKNTKRSGQRAFIRRIFHVAVGSRRAILIFRHRCGEGCRPLYKRSEIHKANCENSIVKEKTNAVASDYIIKINRHPFLAIIFR